MGFQDWQSAGPGVGIAIVAAGVVGLLLSGATTEVLDDRVPLDPGPVAAATLVALLGIGVGFWFGARRA